MFLRIGVLAVVITFCQFTPGVAEETTSRTEEKSQTNLVRLFLPPAVPAVVGQECNIYFDNVVLVPSIRFWLFDVRCAKGQQQSERWTWTPTEADVGIHAFELEVRDAGNNIVASAKTSIKVVAADRRNGESITMLCIGDSLTHASAYTGRVLNLCEQPDNPKLKLIGSHGDQTGPNRHEGYGGWTAKRFATHYREVARTGNYRERGSPFLYLGDGGPPKLDFAQYCRDVNDGFLPAVVTIFLGPNDIFHYTDKNIDAGIDDMLTHFDLLIEMIRTQSPQSNIGILLPVPPAASQDAFGANYGSGQTRWQYKRNQHRLVERMLALYANRENENIHLLPTVANLDCEHNYPASLGKINSSNPSEVARQNNGVHPAAAGYDQIGDTLYAWLKGL